MDELMTRSVPDGAAMIEASSSLVNDEGILKKPADGFVVGGCVKSFAPPLGMQQRAAAGQSLMERSLPSDYGSCSLPYSPSLPPAGVPADVAPGQQRTPLRFIDDKTLPRSLLAKPQVPFIS
jgi:hypothetical protein